MNSDTPRTDALDKALTADALSIYNQGCQLSDIIDLIVGNLYKHARTLERENQQLRDDLKQCADLFMELKWHDLRDSHTVTNCFVCERADKALSLPSVQAALKGTKQ